VLHLFSVMLHAAALRPWPRDTPILASCSKQRMRLPYLVPALPNRKVQRQFDYGTLTICGRARGSCRLVPEGWLTENNETRLYHGLKKSGLEAGVTGESKARCRKHIMIDRRSKAHFVFNKTLIYVWIHEGKNNNALTPGYKKKQYGFFNC
jgi:hypothetical protein